MVSGDNLITIYVSLELMALVLLHPRRLLQGGAEIHRGRDEVLHPRARSPPECCSTASRSSTASREDRAARDLAMYFASAERSNLLMLGILLILAGLLFKIAAVPFHVWTPDVYEGSPTPSRRFSRSGPKIAAYAILARIFYVGVPEVPRGLGPDRGPRLGRNDDSSETRRAPPVQHQEDARLLLDRPRGLRAARRRSGFRSEFGVCGDLDVPARLHVHEFRRLRARHLPRDAGATRRSRCPTSTAWPSGACRRRSSCSLFLLSLAGFRPTAGFIGKYYLFTAAMKAGLRVARGPRRARFGRFALLLLPDRRSDVLLGGGRLEAQSSYALTAVVAICAAGTLASASRRSRSWRSSRRRPRRKVALRGPGAVHGSLRSRRRGDGCGPLLCARDPAPATSSASGSAGGSVSGPSRPWSAQTLGVAAAFVKPRAVHRRKGFGRGTRERRRPGDPPHPDPFDRRGAAGSAAGAFILGWRTGPSLTICAAVVIFSFLVFEKLTGRLVPPLEKRRGSRALSPPSRDGCRAGPSRVRFRWKGFQPVAGCRRALSAVVVAIGAEIWSGKEDRQA